MAPVPNGGRRLVGRTVPEGSLRPQHRSTNLAAPLSGITQSDLESRGLARILDRIDTITYAVRSYSEVLRIGADPACSG